jgi:hypothetical protein
MPSVENRLESVEEELQLVKGEIKRTLVDLRTVTMQADAPFRETPRSSRGGGELRMDEIQASSNRDRLEDPQQNGAALLDRPATRPQEDAVLQPSGGSHNGIARKQAGEWAAGSDIRRDHTVITPQVSPGYPGQGQTISPASLDLNGISRLVRWVSKAQRRLGIQYLESFLELYIKATNGSPDLKTMIMYISTMLGDDGVPQEGASPRTSNIAEQWDDLMPQLHGILNAQSTTSNYSKFSPEGSEDKPNSIGAVRTVTGRHKKNKSLMEEDEVKKVG